MVTTNENIINRKIVLIKKGLSISTLALQIGYTRQGVNKVICGRFKSVSQSAGMLDAISTALGVTKEEFWPEFFTQKNTVSHDVSITAQQDGVN